jgi:hypothetical protein
VAGDISASSNFSGDLKRQRRLEGYASCFGGMTAKASVERRLAGSIAAQSQWQAFLVDEPLFGTLSATSNMIGRMTIIEEPFSLSAFARPVAITEGIVLPVEQSGGKAIE